MTSHLQPPYRHSARPAAQPSRNRGFTLVELMIAVVVMGLLLAVAFPSYMDSIRKGRRAEGIAALTAVQQAQERFRANNASYGSFTAQPQLPNALALASSANSRYTIAVTGNDDKGYTLTATAVGAQADDTPCVLMGVQADRGSLKYGSGTTSINWTATEPDAGRCWAK